MKPIFIIGDVHGQLDLMTGLLQKAGVLNDELDRNQEVTCMQIGDLLHCGEKTYLDDLRTLENAQWMLDFALVGNHEYIYYGPTDFKGSLREPYLHRRLLDLADSGWFRPSHLYNDVLITHAGLVVDYAWPEATAAHDFIMRRWETDRNDFLFSGISRYRGGPVACDIGGIFWSDYASEKKNKLISQVFGHTPQGKPVKWQRKDGTFTYNIDIGGKIGDRIAGLWLYPDKEPEVIIYSKGESWLYT